MTRKGIPEFDRFACLGDTIAWEAEGFDVTARIAFDDTSRPEDSEGYSKKQIGAWENNDWFFCGVVLSVSRNGVGLSDHAASLWGIECNFPSRRKNPNAYLSEVCANLESEALDSARAEIARTLQALKETQ